MNEYSSDPNYLSPWVKLALAMKVRVHRLQLNDGMLWKHLAANVMPVKYVARPLWK